MPTNQVLIICLLENRYEIHIYAKDNILYFENIFDILTAGDGAFGDSVYNPDLQVKKLFANINTGLNLKDGLNNYMSLSFSPATREIELILNDQSYTLTMFDPQSPDVFPMYVQFGMRFTDPLDSPSAELFVKNMRIKKYTPNPLVPLVALGNIKIFNDKIERVTDTGAIIPYTDQEILFDNSSIINFTGSDVISDEQTSGVYDTTLVPRKRSTRDNSKFYKIFDVTIVSESQNLIFSSVLYRNYVKLSTGEMVPTDLSYHVIFSYYSLSQITLKDKDGNDCISFNGNEIWFDYVANSEYLHVSLVPNYTISIVSR